uniref:Uncharacterized protein n=2 Tax=Meloidogyne enterolobii TaxID=390850 RepID=A0A6V7W4Q6_MELEN|nr:unnamed protein product [Meloidogyne enterolobii]
MYADDIKLYVIHNNDSNRDYLEKALKSIETWTKENHMEISINKCSVLHIGNNNSSQSYLLNDKVIQVADCIRDLGVIIDNNFSFSFHIDYIIKKTYSLIHLFFKFIKVRILKIWVLIYKIYIRPNLEYASQVWSPQNNKEIIKIEKVQKMFTRVILKKCGLAPRPYPERLNVCQLRQLSSRRASADLCMVFKIIKNTTNLIPTDFFTFSKRCSRKPHFILNSKYDFRNKQDFFIRMILKWNNLPAEITKLSSIKNFRTSIDNLVQ